MPPKKKTAPKPVTPDVKKDENKPREHRSISEGHHGFVALLVLIVGFSAYALASFVSSNENYIDSVYTNISSNEPLPDPFTGPQPPEPIRENPFIDFDSSHENAFAIIDLYYRGVLGGYSDGTFRPNNKVNRAEFTKMLATAADLDYASFEPNVLSNCFSDVRSLPEHWFAPFVCAAKAANWTAGYSNGTFRPANNIVKAEAAKIILLAFDFAIPVNSDVASLPYSDISRNDWFLGVAAAAKAYAVTADRPNFIASWEVTRGQVAQMIYNAMQARELEDTHL